jgi:hypothetical protein
MVGVYKTTQTGMVVAIVDTNIAAFPESVNDPIDKVPRSSGLPWSAPFTECFVDANLPGGIFENTPFFYSPSK